VDGPVCCAGLGAVDVRALRWEPGGDTTTARRASGTVTARGGRGGYGVGAASVGGLVMRVFNFEQTQI